MRAGCREGESVLWREGDRVYGGWASSRSPASLLSAPRVRLGGRLLPSSGAQPQWASWLSPLEVQACAAGVPSRTRKYRLLVLTYCHKITSREN